MNLISKLYPKYKKVSIIGMSKNAGKTFTLNALMEQAEDAEISVGISSVGRDGERIDIVTETEKPTIYMPAGSLVATTTKLMAVSEATLSIREVTPYDTPLGPVVIAETIYGGNVQVSGPQALSEMAVISDQMLDLGADLVIVDGALDRKSQAAPEITEATLLATGAAYSRNMETVVEDTTHIAHLFSLPEIPTFQKFLEDRRHGLVDREGNFVEIPLTTGLMAGRKIGEQVTEKTEYVIFSGALVTSVVRDLFAATKYRDFTIIVADPTKIFIDAKDYKRLVRRGFRLAVSHQSPLVAITTNPYAPEGYQFDGETFRKRIAEKNPQCKVVDLMRG